MPSGVLLRSMLRLAFVGTLVSAAAAQDVHSVRGSDGAVKFSVTEDGSASAVTSLSAPSVSATEAVTSPTITASGSLLVGTTDVASTLEANAAERAAMQQALDKLEADAASNAIAEQEQNARAEKIEADLQANGAADAEVGERVSKLEADSAAAAAAELEQGTRVEKIEADAASNSAADAELKSQVEEMQRAFDEKLAAAEADYVMKIAELQQKSADEHGAQQRVLDHLVKIMARFDVSGELEGLRQAASSASSGGDATPQN
eukprot:g3494.t1